jgi:hypothetical protein
MIKEGIITPVTNYVVSPVKDYVVSPVKDYIITPVITNPINNFIVNPIQNLVGKKEVVEIGNSNMYTTLDPTIYTTFWSYPVSLLEHEKVSYTEHLRQSMYYSGVSFTASLYFFINALLPNTLQNKGHAVLENLKKND